MTELADIATRVMALPPLVDADEVLRHRGRFLDARMHLAVGEAAFLLRFADGRIAAVEQGPFITPSSTFTIAADAAAWERFCAKAPAPGYHDLFELLRRGEVRLSGNLQPFMAYLLYFKGVLAHLRERSR